MIATGGTVAAQVRFPSRVPAITAAPRTGAPGASCAAVAPAVRVTGGDVGHPDPGPATGPAGRTAVTRDPARQPGPRWRTARRAVPPGQRDLVPESVQVLPGVRDARPPTPRDEQTRVRGACAHTRGGAGVATGYREV